MIPTTTPPGADGKSEELIFKLRLAQNASCSCMTKTNEVAYHAENCLYRVLDEAVVAIAASAPVQPVQGETEYGAIFRAIGDAAKIQGSALAISVKQFKQTLASKGYAIAAPLRVSASAPVQGGLTEPQRQEVGRTLLGLRDGWATRKDADAALAIMAAAAPLQVSGATAPLFHHYGLSAEQLQQLLDGGLKPDEISGADDVQHGRVHELIWWFSRFTQGNANPKWAVAHACELAYFIATNSINRHIDLEAVRNAAFKEGVNITPEERGTLERIGFAAVRPATPAAPVAAPDEQKRVDLASLPVYERMARGRQDLRMEKFYAAADVEALLAPLSPDQPTGEKK
jgi:hypothetical protein